MAIRQFIDRPGLNRLSSLFRLRYGGAYDPDNDPSDGTSLTDLLDSSESTVQQLMGIQINTPLPHLSDDKMLPLQAQAASSFYVFDKTPAIPLPDPCHPTFIGAWIPGINLTPGDAEAFREMAEINRKSGYSFYLDFCIRQWAVR
ncbi:hypothetical protein UA08_01847 [Talaromyces atroroseus]|uniref:Uncharacterized protein n=1 Tax=Talaromyces atroroseus TaxID=1441469 RepID=A0A1Q5QAF4_TALAT|nr:hypothetical protein UA08_01847 [Talaromyces atroroseus]OKL62788.1 hypothetical protein UA08_01847 [Talaromyces atroroseus]